MSYPAAGFGVRPLSEASTPTLLRQLRSGRLAAAVIGAGSGLPDYDLKDSQSQW
jgi:hypothetical protein